MSLRQTALRGVKWSAFESMGNQIAQVAVFLVLARLLKPVDFGVFALASTFVSLIQLFSNLGLNPAVVQRHEIDPEHLDTVFWTTFGIGILLMAISFIGAGLVADLFSEPQLKPVIQWLSPSFIFQACSGLQYALLERNLRFRSIATRSLLSNFLGGAVGIGMAILGNGVWSLVGRQLVSTLIGLLALWAASDWRPRSRFSLRHLRDLLSFGASITVGTILDFANRRSSDFIIGYFLGPIQLGYYSVASRLLLMTNQALFETGYKVAWPIFSQLQKEPERLLRAFATASRITNLVAFPIFMGFFALAPELIAAVFGDKWLSSAPVLQILALGGVAQTHFQLSTSVTSAIGKASWFMRLQTMFLVINTTGLVIAAQWGIDEVAAAYVGVAYLLIPLSLQALVRYVKLDVKRYAGDYLAPAVASFAMVIAIFTTKWLISTEADGNELLRIVSDWIGPSRIMQIQLLFEYFETKVGTLLEAMGAASLLQTLSTDILKKWGLLILAVVLGALVYISVIRMLFPAMTRQLWEFMKGFVSQRR